MKYLSWAFLLWAAAACDAQTPCPRTALADAASRVHSIQEELKRVQDTEINTDVPAIARDQLTQLKDALSCAADAALAQAEPSVDAVELQNKIADVLHANPPEPPVNSVISNDDHRFDEALGSYGHNLRVRVERPPNLAALLKVEFSVNIPCSHDHMLLIYTLDHGAWKRHLRWQAPPLKEISDAFGDFFVSAILFVPGGGHPLLRVVVAHGTAWCMSRFSAFSIDVLSPGSDPNLSKVLWHTKRGYSRGGFVPKLTSSGETFELRVNDGTINADSYERQVVYRYRLDPRQGIRRIEPIAIHARGFVEEWLSSPWSESEGFSAQQARSPLKMIHSQFAEPTKSKTEFVAYGYGPVRACNTSGIFQVEIRSTLEKIVPGKPGGESRPLPTHYFHVREMKDGYLMVSAPTEPDPACTGANLMPD